MKVKHKDEFLEMRKEIIEFIERERKGHLPSMDLADGIIVSWMMPYGKRATDKQAKQVREVIDEWNLNDGENITELKQKLKEL